MNGEMGETDAGWSMQAFERIDRCTGGQMDV